MRRVVCMLTVVASLAFAGDALAGCWATVGISPLPSGVEAGSTWNVGVRVLQHGRTPLADARPNVLIRNENTGVTRSYAALAQAEPGLYRATIAFPAAGDWSVAVNDGFPVPECAQTHTFGTFVIGPAPRLPVAGASTRGRWSARRSER